MEKELDEKNVKKFLEMDFNNDPERHEIDWYLERVPNSFYTYKEKDNNKHISALDMLFNKDMILTPCKFHMSGMDHGFYCKPSWDWINPLADYLKGKKVLDVMAGNGLISLCLKHLGVDVDACDRAIGEDNEYTNYRCWDFPIISGEKYIEDQKEKGIVYDTILMIWPEYDGDGSDKKICDLFLESNPNGEIIFIGEDAGGCTGSDAFFDSYELDWIFELSNYYTPDWGIHDGIYRASKIRK